jgi:hypothetical protein
VLVCDEQGSGLHTQELCPGNSCVDGACQEDGGTDTGGGETDPDEEGSDTDEEGTSPGDGTESTPPGGDGGANDDGQLSSRGCGCALEGRDPVLPWLSLLLLMGVRRRIVN